MLVTLGFLIAALIVVVLLPAYRHRIERFTTAAMKRSLPLTEAEIRADKDRLRADFAMELHRLGMKVEEGALAAARQSVEINRRDAKIQELKEAITAQKMSVEEHENARRVLEQAILDRLPKVEQRLAETRKLLATRDREIRELMASSAKQAAALEQATQLNVQREKELSQLRLRLDTRASRNRESISDSRFDRGVALKSELESLRAKNRDQAALIERLQAQSVNKASSEDDEARVGEVKRLSSLLAKAEAELAAIRVGDARGDEKRLQLEARIKELETIERENATELAKLNASLKAYQDDGEISPSISQKAELSALQAEVEEQRRTIVALRAEVAANQERLTRQAAHFHDELNRVGPAEGETAQANADISPRKSLAERIAAPRVVRMAENDKADGGNAGAAQDARPAAQLRALNGTNGAKGSDDTEAQDSAESYKPPPIPSGEAASGAAEIKPARRPRLLERISGIEKR